MSYSMHHQVNGIWGSYKSKTADIGDDTTSADHREMQLDFKGQPSSCLHLLVADLGQESLLALRRKH